MREDGRATHDWTNGVCIEDTLSCSWQEVGGFTALEILVKIDQESDARPKGIVELRVDNPVEVVGQDADISILTKRRIRDKVDAFACSDNGLALFGIEQVGSSTQALYNRMWLTTDNIEVPNPSAKSTKLRLLATYLHLSEENSSFSVFAIGKSSSNLRREVCSSSIVNTCRACLSKVVNRNPQILAEL
ncbi:hypothetical protein HG530_010683 [Fusarium avenaceum]|nr:hypothetical protein HG530_010683 [Fusarium avenaceum]